MRHLPKYSRVHDTTKDLLRTSEAVGIFDLYRLAFDQVCANRYLVLDPKQASVPHFPDVLHTLSIRSVPIRRTGGLHVRGGRTYGEILLNHL